MTSLRPLRSQAQSIALRESLDVASIEELHSNLGVEAAELAKLAVLAGDERLLHHRDLDEEVLLGEVEVRRERADGAAFAVAFQDERVRLVVPRDPVVVEDLRALEF